MAQYITWHWAINTLTINLCRQLAEVNNGIYIHVIYMTHRPACFHVTDPSLAQTKSSTKPCRTESIHLIHSAPIPRWVTSSDDTQKRCSYHECAAVLLPNVTTVYTSLAEAAINPQVMTLQYLRTAPLGLQGLAKQSLPQYKERARQLQTIYICMDLGLIVQQSRGKCNLPAYRWVSYKSISKMFCWLGSRHHSHLYHLGNRPARVQWLCHAGYVYCDVAGFMIRRTIGCVCRPE